MSTRVGVVVRVVILGHGSIGRRHHDILSRLVPRSQFRIYDPFLGFNVVPRGRFDVGIVATPTSSHLDDVERLVDSCDIVFVEKPLHTDVSAIRARRSTFSGRRIHVGCNVRYTDAVRRLRDVSDSARLVNVFAASDLNSWRNDPLRRAYSFHRQLGGGVLMDFIHEPDYMTHALGPISSVSLIEDRMHENVTVDSTDTCVASWRHPTCLATLCLSYGSKEYIRRIDVLTESGGHEMIHVTKDDVVSSYERQWKDVLENGPRNTYEDCLSLYSSLDLARPEE